MQVAKFTDGGFVLHRVKLAGYKAIFSAWYNAAGELLDAECRTQNYTMRAVPAKAVNTLRNVGKGMTKFVANMEHAARAETRVLN